ncbi:MAG TPA: MmcQ/YjbR family DNA-binding protein, partial [Methylomirabilota bacterium]|nr:MmcQ/YjbR family DNA-binding protein [Methylomirabilota bacterium]
AGISSGRKSTTRNSAPVTTFDDVRRIALALPDAEERLTWETDITFRVRDKIFAIGGEGADRVSVKASLETQAELIDLDPETFASSAYVGRFGWVTVDLDRVDPAVLASLIREAWRRSAPKRLAATLEDA